MSPIAPPRTHGIQRVVYDIPPTQGKYDFLSIGPGIPIQGFVLENFSPFYVYLLYGKRVPDKTSGWNQRVNPYYKEAEECHTDYIGYLVESSPSGKTATDVGDNFIRMTLSTEPIQPLADSLLAGASAPASSVTLSNKNAADNADGLATTASVIIPEVIGENWVYNGASWDRARAPNVFKSAQATASGSTALWTPAGGKKFRLLGYVIELTDNTLLAVAGVLTVKLLDAAADIGQDYDVYVPAAGTQAHPTFAVGLGPLGVLSAVANNTLNINLSAALTAGNARVNAFGTEE